MSTHYLGLDAKTIPTEAFQLTQAAVQKLVTLQAMGVLYGEAGMGKTFAAESAYRNVGIPSHWLRWPSTHSTKDVAEYLVEALTAAPAGGTKRQLTQQLVALLGQHQRFLVVDEAQELSVECLNYLRHLWDHPDTTFSLLFVGGNQCLERLSRDPMTRSRLHRKVEFTRLSEADLRALLPSFHPIYSSLTAERLDQIVDAVDPHCGGSWRAWASFTLEARDILRQDPEASWDAAFIESAVEAAGLL